MAAAKSTTPKATDEAEAPSPDLQTSHEPKENAAAESRDESSKGTGEEDGAPALVPGGKRKTKSDGKKVALDTSFGTLNVDAAEARQLVRMGVVKKDQAEKILAETTSANDNRKD